ncbi:MAG: B12-binding domain-containing radical SAM protein, partial [bacterium]
HIRARGFNENLPWSHINSGIRKEFLVDEYKKSFLGLQTSDCRHYECSSCGVCFGFQEAHDIFGNK